MIPKLELNRTIEPLGFKERQTMCKKAFTLIEIIVVVVILGIAAMLVIPMGSSAASVQLRSAANMIAADIEYAKSLAITKGSVHSVLFDTGNESYSVLDNTGTVVGSPIRNGSDYNIDFQADNRLSGVDIQSVDFDSTSEIKFDYLGCPFNGGGSALASGTITLRAGGSEVHINVEPVTGYITITD